MDASLRKLLPLERRLVLGILAQVTVGARLFNFLRQHEGDLVIEPFDFGLELLLESLDHPGY